MGMPAVQQTGTGPACGQFSRPERGPPAGSSADRHGRARRRLLCQTPAMAVTAPAQPFTVHVADEVLDDLRYRLEHTRWPLDVANEDWRYGTNRDYLMEFVDYWAHEFDWRAAEAAINAFANYRAEIDGVPIHYIHEEGRGPKPIPLVLTHGWPWTFWDLNAVIRPLADPAAYGGDPADAFHV